MDNKILEIIKQEKPFLQKEFGVEEIGLFGSFARGDAGKDSDVDILVKMNTADYGNFAGLYLYLQEKLKKNIDLVYKSKNISQRFQELIQKEIIYV